MLVLTQLGLSAIIVSPTGSDSGDGSEAHPFATAARAQAALRQLAPHAPASVLFRAGTYELNGTLVLDPRDSDTTWALHPDDVAVGASATLSGGTRVGAWAPASALDARRTAAPSGSLMSASIPSSVANQFSQLWVGGVRATRARTPNVRSNDTYNRGLAGGSTLHWENALDGSEGAHGFVYAAGDVDPSWAGTDAEVWAAEAWTASWHTVKRVDAANRTIIFNEPANYPFGKYAVQGGRRYVVENLPAFLDAPSEWVADFAQRRILLWPPTTTSTSASTVEAVIPRLATVVRVAGARNVAFDGLTVAHATDGGQRRHAYFAPTGMVELTGASENVTLSRCSLEHAGANGLLVTGSVRGVAVTRTNVSDVGADGISLQTPTIARVLIEDAIIDDTGKIYNKQPAGVRLKGNESIVLRHSRVSRSPYGGVLVGWQPEPISFAPPPPSGAPPVSGAPSYFIWAWRPREDLLSYGRRAARLPRRDHGGSRLRPVT